MYFHDFITFVMNLVPECHIVCGSTTWTEAQRKKTAPYWSSDTDGPPVHTTTSIALGSFGSSEFMTVPGRPRTNWRDTGEKTYKIVTHLGGGRGSGSRLTCVKRDIMHPYGTRIGTRSRSRSKWNIYIPPNSRHGLTQSTILCWHWDTYTVQYDFVSRDYV